MYVGELSPVTLRKHMGAPLLTNTFTASDANEHLGSVFMVFDFFDFDLYKLIRDKKLTLDRIKSYTLQLVSGLCVMANRGYLHRDLKPANLLVNKQNELVIADFGLARPMPDVVGEGRPMTTKVCTLYYRAPELLLGCTAYDSRSDMWAVGLMVLEMFTRRVALPGATEGEQLGLIVKLVGSPNIETTQVLEDYPHYNTFKNHLKGSQNNLRRRYESILPPDALDLVEQLLVLNPKKRLTAQQVLGHPFFMTSGKYIEASELPSLEEHPPQAGEQPSTAAARPGTGAALRPEAPTLVPADPDPVAFEPAQPQGRALKRTRDGASVSPSPGASVTSEASGSTQDRARSSSMVRPGMSKSRSASRSSGMLRKCPRRRRRISGGQSGSAQRQQQPAGPPRPRSMGAGTASGPPRPRSLGGGPPRPRSMPRP